MLEATYPRIFIYLRLRRGQDLIAKTKIREFRGLGSLLADMTQKVMAGDIEATKLDEDPVFEYVDANSEQPLLVMRTRGDDLHVSGTIPSEYQARMLNPEEGSMRVSQFVERASSTLDFEDQQTLRQIAGQRQRSLLQMIRNELKEDGHFEFLVPKGPMF